jgi:hypothetical protein
MRWDRTSERRVRRQALGMIGSYVALQDRAGSPLRVGRVDLRAAASGHTIAEDAMAGSTHLSLDAQERWPGTIIEGGVSRVARTNAARRWAVFTPVSTAEAIGGGLKRCGRMVKEIELPHVMQSVEQWERDARCSGDGLPGLGERGADVGKHLCDRSGYMADASDGR